MFLAKMKSTYHNTNSKIIYFIIMKYTFDIMDRLNLALCFIHNNNLLNSNVAYY